MAPMRYLVILVALITFPSPKALGEYAQVLTMQGSVTFNGKAVQKGQWVKTGGVFKTAGRGRAKILIKPTKTFMFLNPNSEVTLPAPTTKSWIFDLASGTTRWIVEKAKKGTPALSVRTSTSIMGVRGTDFLASVNPLLGESEIICFDGKVQLLSRTDAKDQKMIQKGQWGGIGGRFGKKIGEILTLPPNVLTAFQKIIPAQ